MTEIVSVLSSAIGVGLLVYALFALIISLTRKTVSNIDLGGTAEQELNAEQIKYSSDKALRILGVSLIILLVSRMVLSLSEIDSFEFLYYGAFVNVLGVIAILVVLYSKSKERITEFSTAFAVILISLIVFALDYVFL